MPASVLVVVPTLNSHKSLPQLCESLAAHSYMYWRVLFVDGPSSDAHRDWLRSFCQSDARFTWAPQDPTLPGIFGAMNHGFHEASPDEWLLFWGSDDWAAGPDVLAKAMSKLESSAFAPDLLVCRGRYADASSGVLVRGTAFHAAAMLSSSSYRRCLLFGSTPPHQATFFGPGARGCLSHYDSGFRLSADLDYFLQLSSYPGLCVQCLDLELVHMADGGVSGQQTQRRLQEVRRAYRRAFGWYWWLPFLMRYLRRVASLFEWSR